MKTNYFDVNALSKTGIDMILSCPAYYKSYLEGIREIKETNAMKFGTLVHTAILEPEFLLEYAPTSLNLTTKEGRAFKKQACLNFQTVVKEDDYESATVIAELVKNHDKLKPIFEDYACEQEFYFEYNGLDCKIKPDIIANTPVGKVCVDIKKTQSAKLADVERTVAKYHYYRQAAWYLNGLKIVGQECRYFLFIFIEEHSPHIITPIFLPVEYIEHGMKDCDNACEIWKKCLETNKYPCFTEEIIEINKPSWL